MQIVNTKMLGVMPLVGWLHVDSNSIIKRPLHYMRMMDSNSELSDC